MSRSRSRTWSIAEARNSLPSLIRRAESGDPVELTRRGEPVAVLIGRRDYDRLTAPRRGFFEAYEAFRRDVALDSLDLDPDAIFADVRDRRRGREIDL